MTFNKLEAHEGRNDMFLFSVMLLLPAYMPIAYNS